MHAVASIAEKMQIGPNTGRTAAIAPVMTVHRNRLNSANAPSSPTRDNPVPHSRLGAIDGTFTIRLAYVTPIENGDHSSARLPPHSITGPKPRLVSGV